MTQPMQIRPGGNEAIMLLRAILEKQDEQNALLLALVKKQHDQTRTISEWKNSHPELAKRCQKAADKGAKLMDGLIERLVTELEALQSDENWDTGAFELNELIDKYGYKFQYFHGLLHTLAQLGKS